jgi:S1-C subfamily serine protease
VEEWFEDWRVPNEAQPQPQDYAFDLDWALSSVVGLHASVPNDAFTAGALGTERIGNGVLIREDGVVLTIGYLITEADQVTLTTGEGREVPGHVLGYDQATGFGLVQALEPLAVPVIPLADAGHAPIGERVVVAGAGGREHSVAGRIVARQEFAGYWEYLLDDAIFTAPAHPLWSGAALIGPTGKLLGIGSLHLQHQTSNGRIMPLNMMVPIEILPPIFDALAAGGHELPSRPWLGVLAQEVDGQVVIIGTSGDAPARRAGLREGDVVVAVANQEVSTLADFYRAIWSLGQAGVEVPLTLNREGDVFDVCVTSRDRRRFLRTPKLH